MFGLAAMDEISRPCSLAMDHAADYSHSSLYDSAKGW